MKVHFLNRTALVLLSTLFIFNACLPTKDAGLQNPQALYSKYWYLESATKISMPEGASFNATFLEFNLTNFSGNSLCNIINGTYRTSSPNGILFDIGSLTSKNCTDPVFQNFDVAYLQELKTVNNWKYENQKLYLMRNTEVRLVYQSKLK